MTLKPISRLTDRPSQRFDEIYVDGTYQAKTAYSSAIAATTDELAIGASVSQIRAAAANGFTGNIGAVHFYNIGLSSTQIYKNCLANKRIMGLRPVRFMGRIFRKKQKQH